ncbi:MAG: TIGR04086 family membrane protein [Clostridia bacterium]|nr:TIGR04086 family membrane protein [Clostridia bacterium]
MDKAYVRTKEKACGKNLAASVLIGMLAALIAAAAALLIFSAAAMKFDEPDKVSPVFGVAALLISALVGGFAAARAHGKHGLSTGALVGLSIVLLIAVASLIAGMKISTTMFAVSAPVAVLTAALGGIVGAGGKKKTKKRKMKF